MVIYYGTKFALNTVGHGVSGVFMSHLHQNLFRLISLVCLLLTLSMCHGNVGEVSTDTSVQTPTEDSTSTTSDDVGGNDEDIQSGSEDNEEVNENNVQSESDDKTLGSEGETTQGEEVDGEQSEETVQEITGYIGPGGGGLHTVTKVYPYNNDVIFVGTDVAGIFRSIDGGVSFDNLSHDLDNYYISDIEFAKYSDQEWIYLSLTSGVYRSSDLGEHWQAMNSGFLEVNLERTEEIDPDNQFNALKYPIRSLAIDPVNNKIIYAGVGLGTLEKPKSYAADYKVYKTMDGGENWIPVLNIDSFALAEGATVYDIYISQTGCRTLFCTNIYVSTDKGFYFSNNAGSTWYLLGRPIIYYTKDSGTTWETCSTSDCAFYGKTTCDDSSKNCLPLVTNTSTNLTNTRTVHALKHEGTEYLYTLVLDDGYIGSHISDCDTYHKEETPEYSVGGLYRSKDKGLTWEHLYKGNETSLPFTLRCTEDEGLSYSSGTTVYTTYFVDEDDPDHYLVVAMGPKKGVFEMKDGDWRNLVAGSYDNWNIESVCAGGVCFEGESGTGLWTNNPPYIVEPATPIIFKENDPLYLTGARGVAKITLGDDFAKFDQIAQNYFANDQGIASTDVEGLWQGTGLDDSCVYAGVVESDKNDANKLILGMGDYGPLTSFDGGQKWFMPPNRDTWKIDNAQEALEMVVDTEAEVVYSVLLANDDETSNVIASNDNGVNWSVVGGYCDEERMSCPSNNNLSEDVRIHQIAIDYSSSASSRRLLLGANNNHSLYIYDPTKTTDAWTQLSGTGCPSDDVVIKDIYSSKDLGPLALISVQTGNSWGKAPSTYDYTSDGGSYASSYEEEGVYVVNLTNYPTITCTRLLGNTADEVPVYQPSHISVAKQGETTYVVTTGIFWGWPTIHRTPFNTNEDNYGADWKMIHDFYYDEESDGSRKSRSSSRISSVADSWWNYLTNLGGDELTTYYQSDVIINLEYSGLVTLPNDSNVILAGMEGDFERHLASPHHILISEDAGASFRLATEFDFLPTKRIHRFTFSHDGEFIYIAPACSSIYKYKLDDIFGGE